VLAEVEVIRNLQIRRLDPDDAMAGFYLIALDEDIRRVAAGLGGTLKTLDAIHVASALSIGDREVQFVTYDDRQANTARECGLTVIQPGR
jgi:hypothetical protein